MRKILIIEDDLDFLEILQKRFAQHSFEVFVALDAFQATELAHTEKPDLILLDLKLPGGGGQDILNNIRLSVHTKTIPIVISTATHDRETRKTFERQGVVAYFEKPYEVENLILKIKEILLEER
jgi:DNA-binding response OmpR family regulator